MTKLTHDDGVYIAMARAARLPVADIAESLGVSVRTISRVAKQYQAGRGRPYPKMTKTATLQRMSTDYARSMVWVAYYERRIEQDPDNPRWHDCMLKWAQLSRGILQDLAQYRDIDMMDQPLYIGHPGTFEEATRAAEEETYRQSFDRRLEDLAAALYGGGEAVEGEDGDGKAADVVCLIEASRGVREEARRGLHHRYHSLRTVWIIGRGQ